MPLASAGQAAIRGGVSEPTSPLQIADYRRFWLARFSAVMATSGMVVVLGYQLYDVARGVYHMSIAQASFQLGLMGLAQFAPFLLLTPVAGIVADRIDRRLISACGAGHRSGDRGTAGAGDRRACPEPAAAVRDWARRMVSPGYS